MALLDFHMGQRLELSRLIQEHIQHADLYCFPNYVTTCSLTLETDWWNKYQLLGNVFSNVSSQTPVEIHSIIVPSVSRLPTLQSYSSRTHTLVINTTGCPLTAVLRPGNESPVVTLLMACHEMRGVRILERSSRMQHIMRAPGLTNRCR